MKIIKRIKTGELDVNNDYIVFYLVSFGTTSPSLIYDDYYFQEYERYRHIGEDLMDHLLRKFSLSVHREGYIMTLESDNENSIESSKAKFLDFLGAITMMFESY